MGMWTTASQDEMEAALTKFTKVADTLFQGQSYTVAFYSRTIVDLLGQLPKKQQREAVNDILRASTRLERQLAEKQAGVA